MTRTLRPGEVLNPAFAEYEAARERVRKLLLRQGLPATDRDIRPIVGRQPSKYAISKADCLRYWGASEEIVAQVEGRE